MAIEIYEIGVTYTLGEEDSYEQIDKRLSEGWVVLSVSLYEYDREITERWTLRSEPVNSEAQQLSHERSGASQSENCEIDRENAPKT